MYDKGDVVSPIEWNKMEWNDMVWYGMVQKKKWKRNLYNRRCCCSTAVIFIATVSTVSVAVDIE